MWISLILKQSYFPTHSSGQHSDPNMDISIYFFLLNPSLIILQLLDYLYVPKRCPGKYVLLGQFRPSSKGTVFCDILLYITSQSVYNTIYCMKYEIILEFNPYLEIKNPLFK